MLLLNLVVEESKKLLRPRSVAIAITRSIILDLNLAYSEA